MATRAIYHFTDVMYTYRVYKHYDNQPANAYTYIQRALERAFALPRFEADEFAASFVLGNKPIRGGGDIRLLHQDQLECGQDYNYYISCYEGELIIEILDWLKGEGETVFKGTLEQFKTYIEASNE